jgi:hypothetical protein
MPADHRRASLRHTSRRLVTALASATILATLGASGVSATPPEGSCSRGFAEATYQEMFELFPQVVEENGEETMLAVLSGFDKNSNGSVCWRAHPTQSTSYEVKLFVANVVDDNAAPR